MSNEYYKLILQFDLSIIYWLSKYKLIQSNEYINKLISIIDKQDSILLLNNDNDNLDLVQYFVNKSIDENFKIKILQSIIEKWMSLVSDWQLCDFKLTHDDYISVKNSIGRIPVGIIGLYRDVALVSPFIHEFDNDYDTNRLYNHGLMPFINYLNNSNVDSNESFIDDEILKQYILDGEIIWRKINKFIKCLNINYLSHYITTISLNSSIDEYIGNDFNNVIKLLPHIKPFPTICYVVGCDTNKKISKLEHDGFIAKYQTLLDSNESLMEKFITEHFHCLISRFRLIHIDLIRYLYTILVNSIGFIQIVNELCINKLDNDKLNDINNVEIHYELTKNSNIIKNFNILNTIRRYGIGGTDNWYRVKCLHSHYAYCTTFLSNSVTLNYINSII